MLGFNETRQIVQEPFASEIRKSLRRAKTGEMTEKEKECEQRLAKARNQYNFTWQ